MHSFLLIGQSNMAGRGFLSEAQEIDVSHIYTLRNGRWQKMFRPINPDRSFSGVSLGESFAEAYYKKHSVDVGLICCADGGTKLSQWMPGELLFENAINQAKLAARTSEIRGILWHQGESDCRDELHITYRTRLEMMLKTLRDELNLPEIPILLGGLGDYLELYPRKDYVKINRALEEVAKSNSRVGFVSAKGLSANPDNLHFNSKSLYEFGIRYFHEFEKFNENSTDISNPSVKQDTERSELELL